MPTAVSVHVYDLSGGLARQMSLAMVGKQVDIIPHTGVVIWGKEIFFGGGICITPAGQAMSLPVCEIIPAGETTKTEADLNAFLAANSHRFTAGTYNLLEWNCNHFSNEVVKFLTEGRMTVPDRIVNVAAEALSTPQGATMRQMLEGMQTQMNAANSGNVLNPLGHMPAAVAAATAVPVASAAPAAPAASPAAVPSASAGGEQLDLESLRAAIVTVDTAPVDVRRACLTTAAKLGQNIVDSPDEAKFRKIRSANGAFAKKVIAVAGGADLMRALGFAPSLVEREEHWVWAGSVPGLRFLKIKCGVLAKKLGTLPAPPPAATPAPTNLVPGWGLGGAGAGGGAAAGATGMGMGMGGGIPPAMMAQAQAMGMNPAMVQQAQQMMAQNPALAAQAQAMMNDPAQMAQMMQMMQQGGMGGGFGGGMGGGGFGGGFGGGGFGGFQ